MASSPQSAPPQIFASTRRIARRKRMRALQEQADAPRYVLDDMVEDVLERLAFLRHAPARALVIGDVHNTLTGALQQQGADVTRGDLVPRDDEIVIIEDQPLAQGGFDLIVSLGLLDTVNDLPGALIHLRNALAPRGLLLASFIGAGSLGQLRSIMLAGDGDRPAARIHPMVDVRAGAQLLQRTGFARQVADSRTLDVRFGSLASLIGDLRAQGLGNVLVSTAPPLTRTALARIEHAWVEAAEPDTKLRESFEILTLSGWAS